MDNWKDQLKGFAQKQGMEILSKPDKDVADTVRTKMMKKHTENISSDRAAWAPYNFVPLNESVVESEPFLENDKYDKDRLTGYIDCNLKTRTPIYIRGCLTESEVKAGKEAKDKPDFFSPNNNIRIPGSSLRGMIRTLVEIVSWSKFGFFEDRGLYYRGLADKSNLRDEYQDYIVDKDDHYYPKIKAGFLKKDGYNYKIIPSKKDKNGCQIYRPLFDKYTKVVNGLGKKMSEFTYAEVYFQQVSPSLHTHYRVKYKQGKEEIVPYQLKYAKLNSVKDKVDGSHPTRGFLVSSGLFGNKKHMHWLINEPGIGEILIPKFDIENYKKDESRQDKANLLEMPQKYPEGIPCFYVEWTDKQDNKRVSFGHTGMFRLAYEKSIGENVPDFLQDKSKTDMAEAIFGKPAEKEQQSFAGRVFFEDAVLSNPEEDPRMEEAIPQILSTPKPTTFQHYLVQDTDNIRNLNHYGLNTIIRGNKLYWHKSEEHWKETNTIGESDTQHTKIQPVKPETEFNFRIRFENLSEVELGALLFALKLPAGCNHKIGMGKPLGLGSIQTTPALVLSDRKKRYESLFDGSGNWSLPKKDDKTLDEYSKEFEEYILGKISDKEKEGATKLWDTYRLKQLKTMLNVEKGRQLEKDGKIKYMQIQGPQNNEFRDRNVLPIPERV